MRAKKARTGILKLVDDRSGRHFKFDSNGGAYSWFKPGTYAGDGDEEDDDDEMKYRSGGSQLKEITVDVGPLGIKLINDPSGMCSDISEHELRQLRTDSSLRYIFNTTVGTVTVLSCTGQAQVKGVEAGDAVFEIQGQRILRGAEHPSVAATIKSMPRPFQMSFLPPGAPDPDTIGASSTLDEESQRDGQQVPGAEQAVESRTAGSGMPPAKERQALYREIQVTFGPGPMGIDLRTIDGSDHLVKALLGGKFGGANPPVIAVKRTIGQAQTLGLKTLDIIVTVNTQPVTPGTSVADLKTMIGAAQRPITIGVARPMPGLLEQIATCKVDSAPQNQDDERSAEVDLFHASGIFAQYFKNISAKLPVSSSPAVRLVTLPGSDESVFSSLETFEAIKKNEATINKIGGMTFSRKPIKAPLCAGIAKGE